MKINYRKYILGLAVIGALLAPMSCSDEDYVEANTNPDILPGVPPQNQFLNGARSAAENDFEYFYDFFQRIMPWMQYVTPLSGNSGNFTAATGNFANRYGRLYTGVGDALSDVEAQVNKLPAEDQPRYVHMVNIAKLLRAYYAFYVSDIYGSVTYTQAWQGRYGGTLEPTYDKQEDLFPRLDEDIEAAIAVLKTEQPTTQLSLDKYDPYYKGDVKSWIRAGNALRLRLATRLLKRNQTTALAIITEVLNEPADNLMSENAHGWVYRTNATTTAGGNWNPDLLLAGKPMVDFMVAKADPRLDAMISKNEYSQENIDSLIRKEKLDADTEEGLRYIGSFTSPDVSSNPAVKDDYYSPEIVSIDGRSMRMDTLSLIQRRLFQPTFDEGDGLGSGLVYLPILTYAEFCFIRADLAARGITGEDAAALYTAGVTASIEWYDMVAKDGNLSDYTPLVETEALSETKNYLLKVDVAYDPAKGVDQIASQAYLNFFKQPAEAWAWWKRTGLPNSTTVVELNDMTNVGAVLEIPRRAPLPLISPNDANYANKKAAYDAMLADPAFGSSPIDIFGRVWWDAE